MKRTLLEALGAAAVLVLLASFHHQLTRLKTQQVDVAGLRAMVHDAVQDADTGHEEADARKQLLGQLTEKLGQLEARVAEASARGEETEELRRQLQVAKVERTRFESEISRDVSRTRELVDAFHREVRAIDENARQTIGQTRDDLRHLVDRVAPDPRLLDAELLGPTVQLNGDDTVGSGTLVYSGVNPHKHKVESYVLTSYHVVRNILADTPSARRMGVSLTIYTADGKVEQRADMISHDAKIDAALLRLRGERQFTNVARVASRHRATDVHTWDHVVAVGCPLGNDPIPTRGAISSIDNELNGSNYWMINAPTYFGNSGGGVYLSESRELVGVFSKIYTHGKGNPTVVPHMGLCTPLDLIYRWLGDDDLSFVIEQQQGLLDPAELMAAPAGN
ncbi:MAG: trypsin-like peptidase domain-containing protein [Planctomycetota bacterium]